MSTSMGMEAISFSEQATAARRDYFAGSNSGVGDEGRSLTLRAFWSARMFAMSGDVVEKFTTPPRCRVTSRAERHRRRGAPLYIG